MCMKKIVIKIKPEDLNLRNEMHFEVQKATRMQIFRNRKHYTRKDKYKNRSEEF